MRATSVRNHRQPVLCVLSWWILWSLRARATLESYLKKKKRRKKKRFALITCSLRAGLPNGTRKLLRSPYVILEDQIPPSHIVLRREY